MTKELSIGVLKKSLILGKNWILKQSPIILTVAGVGGVVATTVMAVKATVEAEKLIEQKKVELDLEIDEKLTIEETVKTCWRTYLPVGISAGLTIAAIIGSSAINEKRKAAMAGLYAISETALKEYQEKNLETIGEKKEQSVRDAVNADKVKRTENNISPEQLSLASLSQGKVLVHEVMSGRYFLSSVQDLKAAMNDLNSQLIYDMCASLNEFYDLIGLDRNEIGDDCGWNIDEKLELYFTSGLTSEGVPYLVLDYKTRPYYGYRDI